MPRLPQAKVQPGTKQDMAVLVMGASVPAGGSVGHSLSHGGHGAVCLRASSAAAAATCAWSASPDTLSATSSRVDVLT